MRASLSSFGVALIALLLMLAPALRNGMPILFPDSVGYLSTGHTALSMARRAILPAPSAAHPAPAVTIDRDGDGVSTERSVYYGAPLALVALGIGPWAAALATSVLALLAVFLLARRLLDAPPPWIAVAASVAAVLGGLGVFATTLMPDALAGPMIAGAAVLLTVRRLPRWEWAAWLAAVAFACLAHKANTLVLVGLVACGAALMLRARDWRWAPLLTLSAVAAMVIAAHALVPWAVQRTTHKPVVERPFLLARLIEDGTASRYLARACDDHDYVLCRYRDRLPMDENRFLWAPASDGGIYKALAPSDRARLDREAGVIVHGALTGDPGGQAVASIGNFARQFVNVGARRFDTRVNAATAHVPEVHAVAKRYESSALQRGAMSLAGASVIMLAAYAAAFAAIIGFAIADRQIVNGRSKRAMLRDLLLLGVIGNAAVFGILSTGADRYQGRIAWIPVLIAACLLTERFRRGGRPASDRSET